MRIKVKDEQSDIRLKVSHKEFILLLSGLEKLNTYLKVDHYNQMLFDKDEFGTIEELEKMKDTMCIEMIKIEENIHPY